MDLVFHPDLCLKDLYVKDPVFHPEELRKTVFWQVLSWPDKVKYSDEEFCRELDPTATFSLVLRISVEMTPVILHQVPRSRDDEREKSVSLSRSQRPPAYPRYEGLSFKGSMPTKPTRERYVTCLRTLYYRPLGFPTETFLWIWTPPSKGNPTRVRSSLRTTRRLPSRNPEVGSTPVLTVTEHSPSPRSGRWPGPVFPTWRGVLV